ncbi:MAG: hypothetical protein LW832_08900 [Parachlamydia sp.]|nr:hypothetical protein [Parachlamydia sp.]
MKVITSQIYDFNFGKWYKGKPNGLFRTLQTERINGLIGLIFFLMLCGCVT